MAELNSENISVFAYDLPGHGRSLNGRWLFEDFDDLTNALVTVYLKAKNYADSRDVPLFLFGHSMGGLITADFVIRHQPQIAGVILAAPALDPGEIVKPWMIRMAGLLRKIVPYLPIIKIPAVQLSTDPAVVAGYEEDPMVYHGKIRVNTGYELLSRMRFVMENVTEFHVPVLIVQGEADTIVRPEISKSFFDQLPVRDKSWKSYPGMYHEALNDIGKEKVKSDIIGWLKQRL